MKKLFFAAVLAIGSFALYASTQEPECATPCPEEQPCPQPEQCNPVPCDTVPCQATPCEPGC